MVDLMVELMVEKEAQITSVLEIKIYILAHVEDSAAWLASVPSCLHMTCSSCSIENTCRKNLLM